MKHLLASAILATAAIAMAQSPPQSSSGRLRSFVREPDRRQVRQAATRSRLDRCPRGNKIESVSDAAEREDLLRRTGHRPVERDDPSRSHRFAHAHFSAGRRSCPRRLRRQHPDRPSRAAGSEGNGCRPSCTRTRIHHAARCRDGRRRIRRHRHQAGHRGWIHPGTSPAGGDSSYLDYRRISVGRVRAGTRDAQGRADCRRASRSPQGRSRATRPWR